MVVSAYASKKAKIRKADYASAKSDYIIQPDLMKKHIQHWKDFEHEILDDLQAYEEDDAIVAEVYNELDDLPSDQDNLKYSPDMFTCEAQVVNDSQPLGPPTTVDPKGSSPSLNSAEKQVTLISGGPSLLQSHEDLQHAIPTSNTICLGADGNPNQHTQVAQALDDTYVVTASTTFVSDADKNYAQTRYPDLFIFGRGGFDEPRDIEMSRSACLKLWPNLGTRQFQRNDFILPMTDCVLRNKVASQVFVRARIPSRRVAAASGLVRSSRAQRHMVAFQQRICSR